MIDLPDNYRQSQYSIQMYTVTVSIEFVPDEFSSAQPELVANSTICRCWCFHVSDISRSQAIPPMEMSKVAQLFDSWPHQGVTLQHRSASVDLEISGVDSCGFEAKMKSSLSTCLGCKMHEDTSLCP